MTLIINLFGGPGTGKSTTAAGLFALLKNMDVNAELINEYVKRWAWEGRSISSLDQFYFFGKQARKEYTLFEKVDVIVTDSPIILSSFYTNKYGPEHQKAAIRSCLESYFKSCDEKNVKRLNVFLQRLKTYNPKGRFQNEEQAKQLDIEILSYLSELKQDFAIIAADQKAPEEIVRYALDEEVLSIKA